MVYPEKCLVQGSLWCEGGGVPGCMQAREAEKKKNKYAEKLADLMVSAAVVAAGRRRGCA